MIKELKKSLERIAEAEKAVEGKKARVEYIKEACQTTKEEMTL